MIGNERDAIKGKGATGFPTELQQGGFVGSTSATERVNKCSIRQPKY